MARSLPAFGQTAVSDADRGPIRAVAAKGFRPFFLAAASFASLIVPLWLLVLSGRVAAGDYLTPATWHAHEMLFGFTLAVIAGFLLTAVGNWTQRETLVGGPLLALCGLWLAGRVALLLAPALPRGAAAVVDLSFVPALAVAIGRPLLLAKNRRNFVMLGLLVALFATNAGMHAEALGWLSPGVAQRSVLVAVDLSVVLIAIMAGRIFPMFTRNATGVDSVRSSPALDVAGVGALVALTVADALDLSATTCAWLAAFAAVLSIARAAHWGTRFTFRQPLLWILHVGYAWIPIGLSLRAGGGSIGTLGTLGIHALTVGALGSVTLGMMARVSLGHTGRLLAAPRLMTVAFVSITGAAVVRVMGPWLAPGRYIESLWAAGMLWTLSFALFVWVYGRVLLRPRVDGKPG